MSWVEWGGWILQWIIIVMIIVFNIKSEKANKLKMNGMNYIMKYSMFFFVASIFIVFLSELTGRSGKMLFILLFGIGLTPLYIFIFRFFGILPKGFCNFLDKVHNIKGILKNP